MWSKKVTVINPSCDQKKSCVALTTSQSVCVLHLSWNCGRSVGASDSESMESPQFAVIDYKSALCMQSQL